MRVLLIAPPFYRILGFYNRYFPFGITMVATMLEKAGHEVKVYDADCFDEAKSIDYSKMHDNYAKYLKSFDDKNNNVWREVEKVIKKQKPDIVGISIYTDYAASTMFVAKMVKKIFPKIKVFVGGPHATVKSDELMDICPEIDFVVVGEGEKTSLELLNAIKNKSGFGEIKGLVYREKGKIISNKKREFNKNVDDYPIPNRSLLINEKKYSSEDMGLIMTSRGCPYNCTFCASTKGLGYRTIENVIEEIKYVKEKYKTVQFTFKDDSFTVDKKRVIELCNKLIDQKIKIKWECNTRVSLIDEELLKLMKKAGCNFIKVGVETGSEKVMKSVNKGITLAQVEKAANLFRKIKIHWSGYFMMGVIGETIEDIKKTWKFIKKIRPNLAIIGTYQPYPGTVMFDNGVKLGLLKNNMKYQDFFDTKPSDYYKIDPKVQTNLIDSDDFVMIEKYMNKKIHKYNKKIYNVSMMALAKLGVYWSDYNILFDDIKKYFKY